MKKYGIGMLLSFDGCKECQDYNRPLPTDKSSFDVVAPKIPLILKYCPNITMRMTLHKPTVHTFYENHKYAVDMGFKNTFVAINTFDDWTDNDFKILEEQMYKVGDLYIDLIGKGKIVNFNPLIKQYTKIKAITPELDIEGGIQWISEQYINNATYTQNTLYKMRWNPASPCNH